MRSLAIPSYTTPQNYTVTTVPVPSIISPTDVIIKVHAASINPADVKIASGSFSFMHTDRFPYKIGHDLSGTIVAVGEDVTNFAIGDEVYTVLPITRGGAASEYAVANIDRLVRKPSTLSHIEAASLPCVAVTALQALQRGDALLPGGLAGKTVFIPAALSGTGSAAILLAKHVFNVAKVITTLSTMKLSKVNEFLGEGTVDQVIDYTQQDVLKEVEKGSVDFYYDTAATCMRNIAVMKNGTGVVVSITSICSGDTMEKLVPTPYLVKKILDVVFAVNRWRVGRWGCKFEVQLTVMSIEDLEKIAQWADEGKYRAVVGRVAKLNQLEEVKDACNMIYSAKGGVGKFVIEID
ncbi:chaperonin 10-like protein [Trichophaea hybrida]|nr:chaperonin 10-like protein [Trichophaea hybrida]